MGLSWNTPFILKTPLIITKASRVKLLGLTHPVNQVKQLRSNVPQWHHQMLTSLPRIGTIYIYMIMLRNVDQISFIVVELFLLYYILIHDNCM